MGQDILNWITSNIKVREIELSFSPLQAVVRFVLPLAGIFVLYKILLLITNKILEKPKKLKQELKKNIYRYTRLTLRIIFLTITAVLIANFFEAEIQKYMLGFWRILKQPFFSSGGTNISIITVLLAIPVFYIASWSAKATKNFVDNSLLNRLTIDESTKYSISALIRYTVLIVVIIIGLSIIGLNLSSLAVIFGVLGIGLGFGLQDTVANFFAGLIIIFERPIKEGDRIIVGNLEGDIVQIKLRSTIINTLTNESIMVPNRKLVGDNIHNYSYKDKKIIIINKVQISYEANVEKARDILKNVSESCPYVIKSKKPEVRLAGFQDSGILMELWSWIPDSKAKLKTLSWINFEIWKEFKENGITIPFPQIDVHMDKKPPQVSHKPLIEE
ncbi:MAG: mechanosensitive ion channel protein MscS [Spirochaetes bacterium]|nr:MAG: mechanosensitive ion channel protein MscS [Spirochaetota bacterium]